MNLYQTLNEFLKKHIFLHNILNNMGKNIF